MSSSRTRFLATALPILWTLSSVDGVEAKRVCHIDTQGNELCQQMISPAIIGAIVASSVCVILLAIAVWLYIRRTRARRAEADVAFTVDANQIEGPPVMVRANTTYAATYSNASYSNYSKTGSNYSKSGGGPSSNYPSYSKSSTNNYLNYPGSAFGSGFEMDLGSAPAMYGGPLSAPGGPRAGGSAASGPSTAALGKPPYPFTGISSMQLPPMPQTPNAYRV